MTRIDEREAEKLAGLAKSTVGEDLVALAAYGSRIAGYATEDSDWDLLAVTRGQKEKARYHYVGAHGIYASILAVSSEALLEDAGTGKLGEFVVGRLLNVYHVLFDKEGVLERADRKYRRRVVLEELEELVFRFGAFSTELLIPPEYPLFSRLKKRATIYPPAKYSYANTYGGPKGKENTEWSAERFAQVMEELAAEGVLRKAGPRLYRISRIVAPPIWRNPSIKLAMRAARQYATHAASGRVGPAVFFKELLSKAKRARRIDVRVEALEKPESLLKLPEGQLSLSGLKDLRRDGCRVSVFRLGEFYSAARMLVVECPGEKVSRYIVKDYMSPWALKWLVARVAAYGIRRFYLTPAERLAVEYRFTRFLRRTGFKTPSIVLVDPENLVMVRSYIEGETLDSLIGEPEAFRVLGRLLGRLHKAYNVTLGDTKPSNFLYEGNQVYVLDCEQAAVGGSKPWDVASFLLFLVLAGRGQPAEKIRSSAAGFLEGYAEEGEASVLVEARNQAFFAPFRPVLQPRELRLVEELLAPASLS